MSASPGSRATHASERVLLDDGTSVDADVVVVGVGVAPSTEWLDGSGLTLENGVVCDETLLAAPGVVAAGDIARWPNLAFGGTVMRLEHWTNATEQGVAAAARLSSTRSSDGAVMASCSASIPTRAKSTSTWRARPRPTIGPDGRSRRPYPRVHAPPPTPAAPTPASGDSIWVDAILLLGVAALVSGVVGLARRWEAPLRPTVNINLSPWALPKYTFFSLSRGAAAYVLSLLFTLGYGTIAAHNHGGPRK